MATARITRGNDFELRIPVRVCKEGVVSPLDLSKCRDVQVTLTSAYGPYTPQAALDPDDSSVLVVGIRGREMPNGLYSVEVTGTFDGVDWRSQRVRQLCIVESDEEADFCATSPAGTRLEMEVVTIGDIVITAIQPTSRQVLAITKDYIDNLFT